MDQHYYASLSDITSDAIQKQNTVAFAWFEKFPKQTQNTYSNLSKSDYETARKNIVASNINREASTPSSIQASQTASFLMTTKMPHLNKNVCVSNPKIVRDAKKQYSSQKCDRPFYQDTNWHPPTLKQISNTKPLRRSVQDRRTIYTYDGGYNNFKQRQIAQPGSVYNMFKTQFSKIDQEYRDAQAKREGTVYNPLTFMKQTTIEPQSIDSIIEQEP